MQAELKLGPGRRRWPASWRRCGRRRTTRCSSTSRRSVHQKLPAARFLIVGDGPERTKLESLAESLGIAEAVRFLGTRSDVPEVLSLMDVLLLTSHMEANPICLLEAMASEKPVVATRVGSVSGDRAARARPATWSAPATRKAWPTACSNCSADRNRAAAMGRAGREHVIAHWSVDRMVQGYEDLIADIYAAKCQGRE